MWSLYLPYQYILGLDMCNPIFIFMYVNIFVL